MKLALDKIRLDGGTQPRAELRDDVIAEYAELMAGGVNFPPITVFFDGETYWLVDGFHRVKAALKSLANQLIEATVYQGALQDAQWFSYGVNQKHGVRRTNADKVRAVEAALRHPKAGTMSNYELAKHCGVSEFMVRSRRGEPASTTIQSQSTDDDSVASDESHRPRRGQDGRVINTARIGRKRRKTDKTRVRDDPPTFLQGLSEPCPIIQVQFSPRSPRSAAATLWQLCPRPFIEELVQELTQRLTQGAAQ